MWGGDDREPRPLTGCASRALGPDLVGFLHRSLTWAGHHAARHGHRYVGQPDYGQPRQL
jgi:hypothetical protein